MKDAIDTKSVTKLVRAAGIKYFRVYTHKHKSGAKRIKFYGIRDEKDRSVALGIMLGAGATWVRETKHCCNPKFVTGVSGTWEAK